MNKSHVYRYNFTFVCHLAFLYWFGLFRSIWTVFKDFEEVQKSKTADPKWRRCRTNYTICKSYVVVVPLWGTQRKQFSMYHVTTCNWFHCHSLNALEIRRGHNVPPPLPQAQELRKSPGKIRLTRLRIKFFKRLLLSDLLLPQLRIVHVENRSK